MPRAQAMEKAMEKVKNALLELPSALTEMVQVLMCMPPLNL